MLTYPIVEENFEQQATNNRIFEKLEKSSMNLNPVQQVPVATISTEENKEMPPVRFGKRGRGKNVGDFCLADIPKYQGEWPQVARVIKTDPITTTVQWYKGSMTKTWKPCNKRTGRTIAAWTEMIQTDSIFYYFNLTPMNNLPKDAKDAAYKYSEEFL
ncbi:unnamed protein product [Owenia fusiformis]|uniref:Uncharacterized protein n=1 Tax=Owenia fusiformis TaxID=6347 RepID=A0A8S4PKI8_OWEFU|nr:unnamed protein product [Owenia fusiformis]